jgi:hypothetical protein
MRNGLLIRLGMAIALLSMTAYADPTSADLRGLLTIGSSRPQTNLKWGMGRTEVQSLYPEFSPITFAVGSYSLQGASTYRGCTFNLLLSGEINPAPQGMLSWARADYERGKLEECRRGLESSLTALYGRPRITKHPAGWPDGSGPPATVISDWRTPTTCIDLWWEDGEGRWNPSLRLTLGVNNGRCGGYDDQVVTTGRRVN